MKEIDHNLRVTIGNLVRKARESKGLSQIKLAKLLGYSNAQLVHFIEKGKSAVPEAKLVKLAEILSLNPVDFYKQCYPEKSEMLNALFAFHDSHAGQSTNAILPELDPLLQAIKDNPEKAKAVAPFLRKILENYDNLPADISRLCDAVLSLSEAQRQGLMAMIGI